MKTLNMTLCARSLVARWMRPIVVAALVLHATASLAAPAGAALVIGEGQYAGQPALPACSRAAQAVSARLQRLGFIVDTAIDASAITVRNALNGFADHVAAAPPGAALVYVCTEATAVDGRLFLLPSDVNLQQPGRPETQGIVVRALVNALGGSKGALVAELSIPPGTNAAALALAFRDTLPDGLHLAMAIGDAKQAGVLGMRLAGDGAELGQGWERLAAALQEPPLNPATALTVYAPALTPAAPSGPVAQDAAPVIPPSPPVQVSSATPEAPMATPEAGQAAPEPHPVPVPAPSPSPPPPRPPERTPERKVARPRPLAPAGGDERTRRLQIALAHRGFYGGPLNGVADIRIAQAVRAYQSSLGDPPSGTLTETEIVRLLNNW